MPKQANSPIRREPLKSRAQAPRYETRRGQIVPEKGASGAPQGGQARGRQGEQEGMRR